MKIGIEVNKEKILAEIGPILKKYYENLNNSKFIPGKSKVSIGWPIFDGSETLSVFSSLLDMQLSQGPKVVEFERNFAGYENVKFAVAVNSGSSANLLALATLIESNEIKPGDEVIIPAATFSTVASPIIQLGLIPVYVDVEIDTFNIDPKEIEKAITQRTKVIMPVHTLGNPANMPVIKEIANKNNLKLIEDFCESPGAVTGCRRVGSFADISTVSFFVAHNMTTGEGGMVFTSNPKYNKILRSLREFGRFNEEGVGRFDYKDEILGNYDSRYFFDRLGFNVRMMDTTAAIGIEQLKKLDDMNHTRIQISNQYKDCLEKYKKWVQIQKIPNESIHTYHGFPLAINKGAPFSRDEIVAFFEAQGIETRAFLGGCLPDQPAFRNKPHRVVGNLSVSRHLKDNAFFIGCHPALSTEAVNYVINTFQKFFEKYENQHIDTEKIEIKIPKTANYDIYG